MSGAGKMTDSWESISVLKRTKQSRNPESVSNRKWPWEAEMREGKSDNQSHREACGAPYS